MSKADNNILGLEHGKIGDRIAVVLDGKQIYKKLYKPTNPRTPQQQKHRAKLAFVNRLSKELADAVNLGFAKMPQRGSGQTARNVFVHENFYNGALVWIELERNGMDKTQKDEDAGEWSFRPDLLCLAQGPRYIGQGIKAEVRDGRLHIICPDTGMNNSDGVTDDQLMVAIYRPAVPTLHLLYGPLREECSKCDFELPETEGEEDVMLVYVWFQATKYHRSEGYKTTVHPGQASKSIYLGTFSK